MWFLDLLQHAFFGSLVSVLALVWTLTIYSYLSSRAYRLHGKILQLNQDAPFILLVSLLLGLALSWSLHVLQDYGVIKLLCLE